MCSKVQTVEKVVEIPQVGQTLQGTTQEVDIPLAPRREARFGMQFLALEMQILFTRPYFGDMNISEHPMIQILESFTS